MPIRMAVEYQSPPQIEYLLDNLDIKTPEVTVVELGGSQDEEPQMLQSFPLFPALPRELRDMIWKFAMPGPQIVEVEVNHGAGARQLNFHFPNNRHWRPHTALHGQFNDAKTDLKLPGLAFACHESHVIGLPAYNRCFVYTPVATSRYEELADARVVPLADIAMPGIFFQPAMDTVYIRDTPNGVADILEESVLQEMSTGDIRSLALDETLFSKQIFINTAFGHTPEYTGELLEPTGVSYTARPWFHSVEEVICVQRSPESINPIPYTPEESAILKGRIEDLIREIGVLKKIPDILILTSQEFKSLPRWRK